LIYHFMSRERLFHPDTYRIFANMTEVHLVRAVQVAPFWTTLKSMGAPVRILGWESDLPVDAVRVGRGVIGEYSLWRFLDYAAERTGEELLGYKCDKSHPITRDVLSRCSPRVQSLEDLLTEFFREVPNESTGSIYRLERLDTGVWLRRDPIFSGPQASWQMEQFFLASFFRVIRTCTGPDWLPPAITVSAHASPVAVPAEWSEIDIEWGHSLTSIFIPTRDLESPPLSPPGQSASPPARSRQPTFPELVARQVRWADVGLEKTADETGLTVITLQRWLRQQNTSYSKLVEIARSKRAQELLRKTDRTIATIAKDLGYRHQSNFTRAFERMVGVSPSAFKNQAGDS
jgi:AraC-like DNA-binding protein